MRQWVGHSAQPIVTKTGKEKVNNVKKKNNFSAGIAKDIKRHKWKYLIILPVIAYLLIFEYKPMYGVIIAFKDYKVHKGIWASEWVGLKYFKRLFADPFFMRGLRNTLILSFQRIIFSFPVPVMLAILLNEVKSQKLKKTIQTITYMPHFISTVVVCGMITSFTQSNGLITDIFVALGGKRQNLLILEDWFRPLLIGSGIWEEAGWSAIVYLAALSAIDQEQYEAAKVDGARRFQLMWHITLPSIVPMIVMMLILRMGKVLNVGFEKIMLLYQPATYEVADVISTYSYRRGLVEGDFSYATAVGLFNSVVGIILINVANRISKKLGQSGLF